MPWQFNIVKFLYLIFYPIINWILPLLVQKIKFRRNFELLNLTDKSCRSFASDQLKACVCFEVSSEGELEQVKPVILKFLENSLLVELIYCSESVERQCSSLASKYPDYLRIFRMPLITYKFWGDNKNSIIDWATAENFFLCRYDFFPELIAYGLSCKFFGIISTSLKGKDIASYGIFKSLFYKKVYQSFDFFTTPTSRDKSLLQIHYNISKEKIFVVDFRALQIISRLKKSKESIVNKIPGFSYLEDLMSDFSQKSIIFGSFWPIEVELFNDDFFKSVQLSKILPLIVPHNLSGEHIARIKLNIKEKNSSMHIYEITESDSEDDVKRIVSSFRKNPGFIILNVKGILCELYSYTNLAFVGGGHGRSVHSLLEPYLANCNIICGPKVYRSTEYDIILERSTEHINIIESAEDLIEQIHVNLGKSVDYNKRVEFYHDTKIAAKEVDTILEQLC